MTAPTTTIQRRARIVREENPSSPREWDNLGTMVCWHRRYTLGDEQPTQDPQEWLAQYQEDNPGAIILKLYLYDHSGITMRTGPFDCPWDSGQVGWIVCNQAKLKGEYGGEYGNNPEAEAKARQVLESEVETYDQYLQGDIYGFILEEGKTCDLGHLHWEHVDSCWGFYGSDPEKNGMFDHATEEEWRALLRKAEVEYE